MKKVPNDLESYDFFVLEKFLEKQERKGIISEIVYKLLYLVIMIITIVMAIRWIIE